MMTKAEEMKVLEKIGKLVESTGEGSYISMAFEGVLEDAEDNINNDFGNSWKQRAEAAEKMVKQYKKVRDELVEERDELKQTINAKNEQIESLVEQLNALRAELNNTKEAATRAELSARREIKLETADDSYFGQFRDIKYSRNDSYDFITVVEQDGWTQSYKMADITELRIQ